MKSITNVVETKYGQGDVPYPAFRCPVVIDGKVLSVLAAVDNATVHSIVNEAAQAVDMVNRFEPWTDYVDFCPHLDLPTGPLTAAMRIELVKGAREKVARIGFVDVGSARNRHVR